MMLKPRFSLIDWCGARRPTDLILILAVLLAVVALLGRALLADVPGVAPVRVEASHGL